MAVLSFLYKDEYKINDAIRIVIPDVGSVVDNQDNYYDMVSMLTATPVDMMVQLDDIGLDFTTIDDYGLFLLIFEGLKEHDTSMIFGDLNLNLFKLDENEVNSQITLYDPIHGIRIDRAIHGQIAAALRKIHGLKRNRKKPANEEAKQYMLERARQKMKRRNNRKTDSEIEGLIVALVNSEQFKYDYEGVRHLSIYQFNESVRQVIKKNDYNNRMFGVYTGTIDPKELSQDDLNWLVHK